MPQGMPRVLIMNYYDECLSLLGGHTPMKRDCGLLCGKACCGTDEDGQGGVYLLPCEAGALEGRKWAAIVRGGPYPLLMCGGPCERELRPFMCRIFPLAPYRRKDGKWGVRMDARASAVCPLFRSGVRGLDGAFVRAAGEAVEALAREEEGRLFLMRMQEEEDAFRNDRKKLLEPFG